MKNTASDIYFHAGNNQMLRKRDVIGIFDLDTSTKSKTTVDFLKRKEKEKRIRSVKNELPKSFILYRDSDKKGTRSNIDTIFIVQLSSKSIFGRIR